MRLNAYVMAADPAWIEASVLSYYDLVREIVVSYDEDGLSWSGTPLDVEQCLSRLRRIDSGGKLRFHPGRFSHPGRHPMENDTAQRQCALDLAGRNADWVLQLDTDEVIADPAQFMACLAEAECRGFAAMDYPARWLYRDIGGDRYLERCSRFWRTIAGFTGSVAVRPGVRLRNARQCDIPLFRVDFRERNTDPWRSRDVPVHRAISPMQGIFHYSWVREEEELLRKTGAWGHSQENWAPEIRYWQWAGRHPRLATLATPFMRFPRRMRIATIPRPLSAPAPMDPISRR
ncbi:MAG: hypothetical protein WCH57_01965 [Verrucomicrobiota bacterium]